MQIKSILLVLSDPIVLKHEDNREWRTWKNQSHSGCIIFLLHDQCDPCNHPSVLTEHKIMDFFFIPIKTICEMLSVKKAFVNSWQIYSKVSSKKIQAYYSFQLFFLHTVNLKQVASAYGTNIFLCIYGNIFNRSFTPLKETERRHRVLFPWFIVF